MSLGRGGIKDFVTTRYSNNKVTFEKDVKTFKTSDFTYGLPINLNLIKKHKKTSFRVTTKAIHIVHHSFNNFETQNLTISPFIKFQINHVVKV